MMRQWDFLILHTRINIVRLVQLVRHLGVFINPLPLLLLLCRCCVVYINCPLWRTRLSVPVNGLTRSAVKSNGKLPDGVIYLFGGSETQQVAHNFIHHPASAHQRTKQDAVIRACLHCKTLKALTIRRHLGSDGSHWGGHIGVASHAVAVEILDLLSVDDCGDPVFSGLTSGLCAENVRRRQSSQWSIVPVSENGCHEISRVCASTKGLHTSVGLKSSLDVDGVHRARYMTVSVVLTLCSTSDSNRSFLTLLIWTLN